MVNPAHIQMNFGQQPQQSEPFKTVTSFFLRGQKLEMKLTNKKKGWAG